MDAAEPGPSDLLRAGSRDPGAAAAPVSSSTCRGDGTWPTEARPSEALRAKRARLTALRDRGLLSSEELSVATARLLGF